MEQQFHRNTLVDDLAQLSSMFEGAGNDPGHLYSVLTDVARQEAIQHVRASTSSYYRAIAKVHASYLVLLAQPASVMSEIRKELQFSISNWRLDDLSALLTFMIKTEGTSATVRKQRSRDRCAILFAEMEGWSPEVFYQRLRARGGGLEAFAERFSEARPDPKPKKKKVAAVQQASEAPSEDTYPFVDDVPDVPRVPEGERLKWGDQKKGAARPEIPGYYALIVQLKVDGEFRVRTATSLGRDLSGFGVDVQRDLLRLASGMPTETSFARSLAGKDALTLHTRTSPDDVLAKCKRALNLFSDTSYKKDYAWIDYVTPVFEQDRIEHLDGLAFAELQGLVAGDASDLHIALPDIISPEEDCEIGYFGTGLKQGAKRSFPEVAIEDYVAELQGGRFSDIVNMAELKASHEICAMKDGKKDKEHKRRLYECFVLEVSDAGKTYVLFSGDWFQVDAAFYADVEKEFTALLAPVPFLATTTATNEQELIKALDKNPDLLMLDKVKVSPTGAPGSNLEPCDFFSRTKQFIHLKDGHSSAPISHLWNQGVVSAESFVRDETFRRGVRAAAIKRQKETGKVGFEGLLPDGRSRAVPTDYTVVFGIMRTAYKKTGKPGLPFFSKVSFRAIANRIQTMSYPVEVHLIEKVAAAKP